MSKYEFEKLLKVSLNHRIVIGDEILLSIESSIDLEDYHCVVFQSSKVVHSSTNHGLWSPQSEISFMTTFDMLPSINVLVYYFHETDGIISDELTIGLEDGNETDSGNVYD